MSLVRKGWHLKVGIEVHARINANTKLFSGAPTKFLKGHGKPNSQVALFDAGIPGTLPHLNSQCVLNAIRTGIAVGGAINTHSVFERKHYFYGDSPLGFQITQQRAPIVTGGKVKVDMDSYAYGQAQTKPAQKKSKRKEHLDIDSWNEKNKGILEVRISRIQLEQDTGRTLEGGGSKEHLASEGVTLVDLNRAGVGVMEIVSEPDMETPEQAGAYVETLQSLLRHIGTSDGNMEEGSLRADVNITIHKQSGDELENEFSNCDTVDSPRIEVKNLNSIRHVVKAVQFEVERLMQVYKQEPQSFSKGSRYNETRSFDPITGTTQFLRRKEGATDYRFFPEPDLPALIISQETLNDVKQTMPELFSESLDRLTSSPNNLKKADAMVLLKEKGALEYFDAVVGCLGESANRVLVANFIVNELLGALGRYDLNFWDGDCISPENLAGLVALLQKESISYKIGKKVMEHMLSSEWSGDKPSEIVSKYQWEQITDEDILFQLCYSCLNELQMSKKGKKMLDKYFLGQDKLFSFFLGQAMEKSNGLAHPTKLRATMEIVLHKFKSEDKI